MIDSRYQNIGYGTQALHLIIALLRRERKYGCIEVCVNQKACCALHVYEKAGFVDAGCSDPTVPDCMNLRYTF
ncbi:MAG TPA: GNAT family protein [Candidatus Limiplasma sp.]|nr:GNAT family protein [Candidatus Limiplasma sp.]